MFRSERKNPVPQCPPRLDVQMLTPVIWSRMPNNFLSPETGRVSERLGWLVRCQEPLTMMALHIPEENRSEPVAAPFTVLQNSLRTNRPGVPPGASTSWSSRSGWTCSSSTTTR